MHEGSRLIRSPPGSAPTPRLVRATAPLGSWQAAEARDHLDVLAAGQLGVDRRELTAQPDATSHRERLTDDIVAQDKGLAATGTQQGRQDRHQRGLAGPVRTEQVPACRIGRLASANPLAVVEAGRRAWRCDEAAAPRRHVHGFRR